MVKIRQRTRMELLNEIVKLKQGIIDLEMEVIRLKRIGIFREFPVKPAPVPAIQPEWQLGDTTGGRPLLNQPLNLCTPVCQGGRGY